MKQIWSAAHTDVGTKKNINQDAVILKVANSHCGKIVFSAICDGMGGLQQGEVASEMLSREYEKWFCGELPRLLQNGLHVSSFQQSLERVTYRADEWMKQHARTQGIRMGTTATILLIVADKYYVFHVGDTRIYQITANNIMQLTTDHTYVQQQVQLGLMSEQQAQMSPNKNVLLQCVGAAPTLRPEVLDGMINGSISFLLCSDGFRHKVDQRELFEQLNPAVLQTEDLMQVRLEMMTEWNKARGETDNISTILLKVF